MTMQETYLKKYISRGGEYLLNSKVNKLKKEGNKWAVFYSQNKSKKKLLAKNIILSAGTFGTPTILRNSKLSKLAGKVFQMHPTVKIIALFDHEINSEKMGVPVHQVKDSKYPFSFGCSISSKSYLNLAMLDHPSEKKIVDKSWKKMAIYYATIIPEANGKMIKLPFFKNLLPIYNLSNKDKTNLASGLKMLSEILLSAGAIKLFPSIKNSSPIINKLDIEKLPKIIDGKKTSLMTVHVFSSCPSGENREKCVVDSNGQVHNHKNLYIADGSILPSATGVNPQGTIMAMVRKNVKSIINKK